MVEKYYLVHMQLMKEWGEYSAKNVCFSKIPALFFHLPDSMLQDLIEVFSELIKLNPKGSMVFQKETIITLFEFCLIIMRTNAESISNHYIKAKALELIAIFIYADEKKQMMMDFTNSDIIKQTLMDTLV